MSSTPSTSPILVLSALLLAPAAQGGAAIADAPPAPAPPVAQEKAVAQERDQEAGGAGTEGEGGADDASAEGDGEGGAGEGAATGPDAGSDDAGPPPAAGGTGEDDAPSAGEATTDLPPPGVISPTVFACEGFGPVPGTDPEDFARWSGWLRERYLGDPDDERREQLDARLEALDIAAATPAYINLVRGLDMASREDVERALAITSAWYERQARYKQLVLPGEPDDLTPVMVRNRLLVLDGWARLWTRTLEVEGGVERFRSRVASVERTRDWYRRRRQELREDDEQP